MNPESRNILTSNYTVGLKFRGNHSQMVSVIGEGKQTIFVLFPKYFNNVY